MKEISIVNNEHINDKVLKEKEDSKPQCETIIISPHPDDECIGCYEILTSDIVKPLIIYTSEISNERKAEALELRNHVDIKGQMFLSSIPPKFLHPSNTFYFPHPIYETHPDHRLQGMAGEQLARAGYDVIFYITEMNAPFKFECKESDKKRELLNKVYKTQSDMWKYEHKYFLFGGYDKWLFEGKL